MSCQRSCIHSNYCQSLLTVEYPDCPMFEKRKARSKVIGKVTKTADNEVTFELASHTYKLRD
jgi:hypothetical protein